MKALTRANIAFDMNQLQDMALYHLKALGEFDAAVRKWENKAVADKMWINIKTFISAEYAHKNKQNKLTAKQFRANTMEEQAEVTEELIVALAENHMRQMETLIKSTTEAMKEMMTLIKNQAANAPNLNKANSLRKRRKSAKRRE